MENEILWFIKDTEYIEKRQDNPLLLLELFHKKDQLTLEIGEKLKNSWEKEPDFHKLILELSLKRYASLIKHILSINLQFIPELEKSIKFTTTHSKYVFGYELSEIELKDLYDSGLSLEKIIYLVKKKEMNHSKFVSEPYNNLKKICFGENQKKFTGIRESKLEYNLLSLFLSHTISKISSPLFNIPHKYSPLIELYKKSGCDLTKEPQFSKYGLIEITNSKTLFDAFPKGVRLWFENIF